MEEEQSLVEAKIEWSKGKKRGRRQRAVFRKIIFFAPFSSFSPLCIRSFPFKGRKLHTIDAVGQR